MGKRSLKISCILIYIIYTSLLIWQIYKSNQIEIYKENEYSEVIPFAFDIALNRLLPAIVLILFAALLYIHIVFQQRRHAIFSSFFATVIISTHETFFSLMPFALLGFGLAIAFFELRKSNQDQTNDNL